MKESSALEGDVPTLTRGLISILVGSFNVLQRRGLLPNVATISTVDAVCKPAIIWCREHAICPLEFLERACLLA